MFHRKTRIESILNKIEEAGFTITRRSIPLEVGSIEILYVKQLTDRTSLSQFVIKPLLMHIENNPKEARSLKAETVAQTILYADDCEVESDEEKIEANILEGSVVILLPNDKAYVVACLKQVAQRPVSEPVIQYTLRGPRDCFVEELNTNISLIRHRVKDKKLRIEQHKVGRRSQTAVAMFYIEDIANDNAVNLMRQRIEAVDIDSINDSGELEPFLQNGKMSLFPQMGVVERSDMACYLLQKGKVLVLVDGGVLALVAPKVFSEFIYSCDDRYDNMYFGMLMRLLRFVSLFVALYGSSFFVAISEFHMDALPSHYVITLAEMRIGVPFPPIIGAFILEYITELLREALLRVPKQIGTAVGIVSAIVIGQAAIAAGIFSPLLLILVSAELLASFVIPDFTIVNPIRVLKFIALLCTGFLGFYGLVLFSSVLLIYFVSAESFGVPYLAPYAPFKWYDFVRTFIFNLSFSPARPKFLRNKDNMRTSDSHINN